MSDKIMNEVMELIKLYPNDVDLGKAIRDLIRNK